MSSAPACRGCPLASCPFAPKRRRAGDRLHVEDGESTHVWYVRRGQVVRMQAGRDGAGERATLEESGTFLGLEALFGERYRASACVIDEAVICRTTSAAFERWIGPPGTPARTVLEGLLSGHRDGSGGSDGSGGRLDGTALARLSRWLLAHGSPPVGMKRRVLAQLLQMTPETLSRALAQLAEGGAIALTRRRIEIADRDALSASA